MLCFPSLFSTLLIFFCQVLDRKSLFFCFQKQVITFCHFIVNSKNTSNAAERFVASRFPVCQASSCWSVWGTRGRFTMWRGISSTLKSHSKFLKCTGLFHIVWNLYRVCLELWWGFFCLFRNDRILSFLSKQQHTAADPSWHVSFPTASKLLQQALIKQSDCGASCQVSSPLRLAKLFILTKDKVPVYLLVST